MTNKLNNKDYFELLHRNIGTLVSHGKHGLSQFSLNDIQSKPNNFLEFTKGFKNYHFCLNVPYAGRVLNWEIIFDPEDYSQLPDFDFNDYSFLPEPDINYIAENVPSWDGWDLTNLDCMWNILNEFLALYKKAQVEKLLKQNKFAILKTQYEELLRELNLSSDKVEVHIESKSEFEYEQNPDDVVLINFLIILPIDFSPLPEYCQPDSEQLLNPGEDFAHLCVQLKKLDNSQTKVAVTLGPRAEQVLGRLKLPKFRKDSTLADYAMAVSTTIENQIEFICEQFRARNHFVSALIDAFSSGIVEYDANKFYKITFIYEEYEDYDCLVTVQLGGKFPQEKPKVQLSSLYCQVGRHCNSPIIYHTYDPQGAPEANIQELKDILYQDVKIFQNHIH